MQSNHLVHVWQDLAHPCEFPRVQKLGTASNYLRRAAKKLIDKYGEPAEVVEEFRTDRQPETDSMRMAALHADQCRYFTRFDFDRQSIELSINNYRGDSVYMNYISLRYLTSIPEIGVINDPETDTIPAAENSVRNNNQ